MPLTEEDADYLRIRAAHFRALALETDVPFSTALHGLADDLEARAAEIEMRPDPQRPH